MRTRILRIASAAFAAALLPGSSWAQDCTPDARQVVDAIYRQVLERNANGEGTTAVSQLNAGSTTVRELIRNMAKSNEHRQTIHAGRAQHRGDVCVSASAGPGAGSWRPASPHSGLASEDIDAVIDNMIDSAEYQQLYSDDTVPGARLRYCGPARRRAPLPRARPGCASRPWTATATAQIERSEWNGSDQSFNVHDWNNDGVLSREEVRLGGRRGGAGRGRRTTSTRTDRRRGRRGTSTSSTATATTASAPASGTTRRSISGAPTATATDR